MEREIRGAKQLLLVAADADLRRTVASILADQGWLVTLVDATDAALLASCTQRLDLTFADGVPAAVAIFAQWPFSEDVLQTIASAVNGVALNIEHRSADVERARYASQLRRLADASFKLNTALALDDLLALIAAESRQVIGAHQSVVSLASDGEGAPAFNVRSLSHPYAAWRDTDIQPDRFRMYMQICQGRRSARLTQAELEAHPAWQNARDQPPLRGLLAALLVGRDGRNLGFIQLSDTYTGDFTAEDEDVLAQFAQMSSMAIDNARLYHQIEQARYARDDLISLVSHDLRNPLCTIKGYAQLVQRRLADVRAPGKERIDDGLAKIDATATKMMAIIEDLLR